MFVSFTLSQTGMLRHWNRLLRTERDRAARHRMIRARTINAIGLGMTGFVLILVLVTKFLAGAWISIAMMVAIYLVMVGIHRHYDHVSRELAPTEERPTLPARNHAIVLVSKVHLPTLRALSYAQGTRPDTLTAVTVNVDDADTRTIQTEWEAREIPVPLTVVDSPYREITRPIIDYVKSVRRESPRDVVTVFIPEYVVGHWWEHLLHNQSALRLKGRLLFTPGVMVTSVPWQLESSERRALERLLEGTGCGATADRADASSRVRATTTRQLHGAAEWPGVDGPNVTSSLEVGSDSEDLLDLTVDRVAHGGACVARHEGRVVFVRHAIPGERVRAS